MIHILLTILKVIGIVLAVVLGLILAILLALLFVPVRYRVVADELKFPKEDKEPLIFAKFTWLLHLVTARADYTEEGVQFNIRLLGINIKRKEKKVYNTTTYPKSDPRYKAPEQTIQPDQTPLADKTEKSENSTNFQASVSGVKEKKSVSQKLSEVINKFKFKINHICDKITNVKIKTSDYIEFFSREKYKNTIKEIKSMLIKLILYILPTKCKGYLKFGFESPETTGKALAAMCMFYGLYGDKIELYPDFENKILEGAIRCKGRIRLYRIVVVLIKLWRNKELKEMIEFVKKH